MWVPPCGMYPFTYEGHRDAPEDEAMTKGKHYRLIPVPFNA
jgi:hypothetical protein